MTTEKLIIVNEGNKFYFSNRKLHREDGPAIVFPDGKQEYWINGEKIDKLPLTNMLLRYMMKEKQELDINKKVIG
jgi:hypothetical protein